MACCSDINLEHDHEDGHGKLPIILFIIGLVLYLVSLFNINISTEITTKRVSMVLQIGAFFLAGYHIIIEGIVDTIKDSIKTKSFRPNVHILMLIAAIGAIIIQSYNEAALLILIFGGAHFIEDYASNKSKREITSLLKLNPTDARLLDENGNTKVVEVSELKIGDRIAILNGDQVPTDGEVVKGESSIDESSITGESIPVEKSSGSNVYGGTINGNGYLEVEVTKLSKDTVMSKIIDMVSQTQENVSKTAVFIKKAEPIYVNVVLILAPVVYLVFLFLFDIGAQNSFYRTMIFLIGTSPCALAVTDVPATLSAISNLAKKGVLFKGGSYLSNLNDITKVTFDKTGTLTKGVPDVVGFYEVTKEDNKEYLEILYAMEEKSNHPLADAITRYIDLDLDLELDVENILGVGIKSNYNNKTYKIGKPSSYEDVSKEIKEIVAKLEKEGKTVVLFSVDKNIKFVIAILDDITEEAKMMVNYFKSNNIESIMITGDAKHTAEAIASKLGIDKVYANVLPEDKNKIVKELKGENEVVAMFGDGVNDAPALVAADIGIAMGEGTDVAIEVADAVLMKNDLSKVTYTHRISKKLRRVVIQNAIFSMFVVLTLVILNFFELVDIPVAVILHEGSTIVVLLNGLRMLRTIGAVKNDK